MKIFLSIAFMITATVSLYGQWVPTSNSDTTDLLSGYFFNETKGFAVGSQYNLITSDIYGSLVKTIDGQNWTVVRKNTGSSQFLPGDITFIDANTGFISSGGDTVIWKTTDGGLTWNGVKGGNITSYPPFSFKIDGYTDINFPSATVGYAVGGYKYSISGNNLNKGLMLKTSNGGATWSNLTFSPSDKKLARIWCFSETNCIAVGEDGRIFKTSNGGSSWALISSPITTTDFFDIKFANSTVGYICGGRNSNGHVLKTTDGGASWSLVYTGSDTIITSIYPYSADSIFISSANGIYESFNGGASWESSSTEKGLITLLMADRSSGFAVGNGGKIMKFDRITNIGAFDESISIIQIFPNPCIQKLNISSLEIIHQLNLYNSSGSLVLQMKDINESDIVLTMNKLEQGEYFAELFTDNRKIVKKVIKLQ